MKRLTQSFAVAGLAATLLGLSTVTGAAEDPWSSTDPRFFLHLGASAVPYSESATVAEDGAAIAGADVALDPSYTLYMDAGWYLTPNWAIALSAGYPPTVNAMAAGTIAPFGSLGEVTGGIIELNGQYHFTNFGRFQPYLGAGISYFQVFNTVDGALTDFQVDNAFGFDLQIGADWMITDKFGVFFDVKKVFISATSVGFAGGHTYTSDVRLDPTIISAGVTLRY